MCCTGLMVAAGREKSRSFQGRQLPKCTELSFLLMTSQIVAVGLEILVPSNLPSYRVCRAERQGERVLVW
eukprot:gene2189-5204_t